MKRKVKVGYLGCPFYVVADMPDGTVIIENCATKLKQEPKRVNYTQLHLWGGKLGNQKPYKPGYRPPERHKMAKVRGGEMPKYVDHAFSYSFSPRSTR